MPQPFRASHHVHTHIHRSILSQTPGKHSGNIGKKNGNGGRSGNTISSSSVRNSRRYAPNHDLPGNIPATFRQQFRQYFRRVSSLQCMYP